MSTRCVRYRSGYKYQLRNEHVDSVAVIPDAAIVTDYVQLDTAGLITLRRGYAWDGPSGPTIDTKNFMRGSLVHDALYQLMRVEELDKDLWREEADRELRRMCREDGMSRLRAWWVFRAVRAFGDPSASPDSKRPVEAAPAGCTEA
jgi:hypothetical protein